MLTRAFYAIKDTRTPVLITFGMIALSVVLSFLLVKPMGLGGLALAYSSAGIFEMIALLVILRIRIGRIDGMRILSSGAGTIAASIAMGIVCYYTVNELQVLLGVASKLSQLVAVGGSITVGILVYFFVAFLLRMEEVQFTLEMLGRRFHIRRRNSSLMPEARCRNVLDAFLNKTDVGCCIRGIYTTRRESSV